MVDFLVVLNLLLTTNQKKAKIVENHLSPELQMAAAGLLGPDLVSKILPSIPYSSGQTNCLSYEPFIPIFVKLFVEVFVGEIGNIL